MGVSAESRMSARGAGQDTERLNELLRAVDWRFLLRQPDAPRTLDLRPPSASDGLGIVSDSTDVDSEATLAVIGFPTQERLRKARAALRPDGELVTVWEKPRPGGTQLARRRLQSAGFTEIAFYWPGPSSSRQPEFWLPLGDHAALRHLFRARPAQTRAGAVLRSVWRAVERFGAAAPVYGIARLVPEDGAERGPRELAAARDPLLLLTGGRKSHSKVVGLSFKSGGREPDAAVKFARTPEADDSVARETRTLRKLEVERPELNCIPRILAQGRRVGRVATRQSAAGGVTLGAILTHATLPGHALAVTGWLSSLAGGTLPPTGDRGPCPAAGLLETLEARFGARLSPGLMARARALIAELGSFPEVWEHRDLDPWNIIRGDDGLFVVDWERAVSGGLPGLDLAYFLLTTSFVIENALSDPQAGPHHTLACHRRLLDPASPLAEVGRACVAEYCRRLGLDPAIFPRLRLLCWITQAGIRRAHPGADGTGAGLLHPEAFLSLLEEEIHLVEGSR